MNTTDNEDSQQSIDRLLRSIISERMAKEYLIEESGYPQDAEERHYFNTEAGKEYQDLLVNKAKSSLLELILSCYDKDGDQYTKNIKQAFGEDI